MTALYCQGITVAPALDENLYWVPCYADIWDFIPFSAAATKANSMQGCHTLALVLPGCQSLPHRDIVNSGQERGKRWPTTVPSWPVSAIDSWPLCSLSWYMLFFAPIHTLQALSNPSERPQGSLQFLVALPPDVFGINASWHFAAENAHEPISEQLF